MSTRKWIVSITAAIMVTPLLTIGVPAQNISSTAATHQQYKIVVLPPDGGPDSLQAGYLFYAPLTDTGIVGVLGDMGTPGFNSYTWSNGKQTNLQPLPQLPNLSGTGTYINWISEWGLAAGYGTRTNTVSGTSFDHAAIWTPDGHIFPLSTPEGDQSHAVWVNDFGQASGWIANSTPDCFPPLGLETQGVVWRFSFRSLLGTLGGKNSYGEFTNDLGQVSGHSETSTLPNPVTGCPPYDPFIWEDGKMVDINPGNFGGAEGGTNFLSNRGHAVGFGTLAGEVFSYAFLWHHGELTNLSSVGTLGGSMDSAFNSNNEGDVVGVSSVPDDSSFHAVMWRGGTFTDLGTVDGDACSQPFRINSHDQIVGFSGACDFSTQHAFLWENEEMVDLDTLIPSNSGIQLQSANWINEEGEIAAQGILTADGTVRAVLLIPNGEHIYGQRAASSAAMPLKGALIKDDAGRLNPMFLRPFPHAMLRNTRDPRSR